MPNILKIKFNNQEGKHLFMVLTSTEIECCNKRKKTVETHLI